MKRLSALIEKKRSDLYLLAKGGNQSKSEAVQCSQELDQLIIQYQAAELNSKKK